MRRSTTSLMYFTTIALLAFTGCSDGDLPESGATVCVEDGLEAQARQRFVAGNTFYLAPIIDSPACADQAWALVESPEANKNQPVSGEDGHTRFTPVESGLYRFSAGATTLDLNVVSAASAPFEHFNYYPSQSLAEVNGELWVANVFSPTVSRLDLESLSETGTIEVGPWPVAIAWTEGMEVALVAHKAGDTIGFVNTTSATLEDALWVGDEPSNVVVTPDGTTAFVTLTTESAVAVVDIQRRAVVSRIPTGHSPMAMALDAESGQLFVARHRSAELNRFPFEDDGRGDSKDIAIIDLDTLEVTSYITAVGSTITDLLIDEGRLLVSVTVSDASANQADPEAGSFSHQVRAYDLETAELLASVDASTQPSSTGTAATLHGLARTPGMLWAAVEGSNQVLGLEPETLEERVRFQAPGRPRALLSRGTKVIAHGAQGFALTLGDESGEVTLEAELGGDPRPPQVALGQAYFTGAGEGYGADRACNNCHLDGLMDGNVWRVGPFDVWMTTRPLFWLEGTAPIGWEAYVADADLSAIAGGSTIGKNVNSEEAVGMKRYLKALVPPPPANGLTARDGQMSAAALRGQEIFEGKAACAACHPGAIKTSRALLAQGESPGQTDIPSLVGIYRFGYYLKTGQAQTMGEAVEAMLEWQGIDTLSAAEIQDMTRYLNELTARDFFVLDSTPDAAESAFTVGQDLELIFSHPVFDDAQNLAKIRLLDSSGQEIPVERRADGRKVFIDPVSDLEYAAAHTLEVAEDFESFGQHQGEQKTIGFTTATEAALELAGDYVWEVDFPAFDIIEMGLNPDVTSQVPVSMSVESLSDGSYLGTFEMADGLTVEATLAVDGQTLVWPELALPLGGTAFSATWPSRAELTDQDGDNVADTAEGVFKISGPGFDVDGVVWRLRRASDPSACVDETTGTNPLSVSFSEGGNPTIDFAAQSALSVYVTTPDASLPLGPGVIDGGEAFWVLVATNFPTGFGGPVDYGQVPENAMDNSEANGAPSGGAQVMAGRCVKFSVQYSDFSTSSFTTLWP